MSRNTHSAAPTVQEVSGFTQKVSRFIATDGRSTIVELSVQKQKSGFQLCDFESIDSSKPNDTFVIANSDLEAAQHFVNIDHVGLEIQTMLN
jgi:hypothetical protein